ncbi:MAG TPA: acyl-homoserine-lactone synthase [Geobacteraceae bacterium]
MRLITQGKSFACNGSTLSSVFVKEGLYYLKNITNKNEKMKVYSLRHRVFCQELGWVPQTNNLLEVDDYDEKAVFFGVFDEYHKIKAFLRVVMPPSTFMLEKEFPYLLSQHNKIRKENDTIEISRLCVAPEARNEKLAGNFGVHSVSMMLYKGVYHWCLKNKIRYLYLVVEEKIYRLLCARGFPCKLIGEAKVMPDGVIAVAAMLDWREFEETSKIKRSKMFAWFSQNQLNQSLTQLPQRGACLPHQVFS